MKQPPHCPDKQTDADSQYNRPGTGNKLVEFRSIHNDVMVTKNKPHSVCSPIFMVVVE